MSAFPDKMCVQDGNMDWVIWEQGSPVMMLQAADEQHIIEKEENRAERSENDSDILTTPVIRRPQYSAVVSRMNNAVRHTGSYMAW